MKNIIIRTVIILTVLFQSIAFTQYTQQWDISRISQNAAKIKFLNAETGYMAVTVNSSDKSQLLKTTDRGQNWVSLWQGNKDEFFTFEITQSTNETVLHLCHQMAVRRSTDFGQTWFLPFNMEGIVGTLPSEKVIMKFFDQNNGYLTYVNSTYNHLAGIYWTFYIFKTNNGGQSWWSVYQKTGVQSAPYKYGIMDFTFLGNNPNHIYFVGRSQQHNDTYRKTKFSVETLDGFNNTPIEVYGSFGIDCESLNGVVVLPNSPSQTRIIVSKYKYNDPTHIDNGMYCRFNNSDYKICNDFLPTQFGGASFSTDNNGYCYIKNSIYKTLNSGQNWVSINDQLPIAPSNSAALTSFGDIVYAVSYESHFIEKYLSSLIKSYSEFQQEFNGGLSVNGTPYPTPFNYYLRGGQNNFLAHDNYSDKVFYKWNDNYLSKERNINVLYDNFELSSNYKTKQKSTDETGISNTCQTKMFRDSEGKYHQIHSSIGGIFYTLSQSSTSGFGGEEVVNGGALYSQQFPNAGTCDLNKNPSINEISFIGEGDVIPNSMSVTAVWERYNQQTNKTDILSALRSTDVNNPWTRFGNNLNALDGKIISFNSTINCNSKPDVYSFYISGEGSEVNSYMMLVPHLEPSQNGNKLVVSARYKNYTGFDYEAIRIEEPPYETNDFVIVGDNVTDYSVTYKPYLNGNNYKSLYLYFTYKKNGNIYYRRESINITSSYNIYRDTIPPEEREYNVSSNDNQTLRNSPDITLRNNLPAVTYQGRNDVYRIVYFDGSEGEQNIQLHYYPILVKMRDANGYWLSYNYNSNGFQTQENPDIEGSVDYDALLINFSKASTTFYQFAKINGLTGYSCSPGYYPGKDAKLIKGSYIGQFGTNSSPGLLMLSNPVNSLYSVGRQLFVITNAPSDGYSNMDGTIEKENILYTLTLGPIIASNTTQGFEDDAPPQTVQNAVEFNETMVSAPFTLSNNDTLILGAHGKYLPSFGQAMEPMKYHVNLVDSATNQIHSELFSDTINVEDSVGIEFLRGFVINNISGGTGRFYVQLLVDTADAGDGDYMMAGVYSDNTLPGGDAPINYRTKVFFKNSSNSLKHDNQIPKSYDLSQNYPNPFNPVTKINYALPKQGFVTLKIYDITGREVKVLVNEFRQAGYYTVDFNGSNLASGVYFYRIQSNDFIHTKRMVLIK